VVVAPADATGVSLQCCEVMQQRLWLRLMCLMSATHGAPQLATRGSSVRDHTTSDNAVPCGASKGLAKHGIMVCDSVVKSIVT